MINNNKGQNEKDVLDCIEGTHTHTNIYSVLYLYGFISVPLALVAAFYSYYFVLLLCCFFFLLFRWPSASKLQHGRLVVGGFSGIRKIAEYKSCSSYNGLTTDGVSKQESRTETKVMLLLLHCLYTNDDTFAKILSFHSSFPIHFCFYLLSSLLSSSLRSPIRSSPRARESYSTEILL